MKRQHRIPAWLPVLVAALGILWGGIVLGQAPQPAIYISPADQAIDVGDETTVAVWISNVEGFYAAQFDLGFDPTVVEGLFIEPGPAFTAYPDEHEVVQNQIADGNCKFAATLLRIPKADPVSGDLHLATIHFRGLIDGTSPLTWRQVKLSNGLGQAIVPTTEDGQIVVGEEVLPGPIGTLLKGVEVDQARNLVYVSSHSNDSIVILDGSTYARVQSVPSGGVDPNGLALSEDGSMLFVVNTASDQVAVLDPDNGFAVLGTIAVEDGPFSIAIANGLAYVTNFDSGSVSIIDVNGMYVVRTLAVGRHPSLPAATGDHSYIPIHSAYDRWQAKNPQDEWAYVQARRANDTGVAIVYADGRLERILQDYIGFFAAAVDEAHGRVYITKRDGTAEGLYVLDLADNSLIHFVSMLRPYAVAVNPVTNHVLVVQADLNEVYVLDANNDYQLIRVVTTDPNDGDYPGMHGGQGIDVHGSDVIVSNFISGTVTIFDENDVDGVLAVPVHPEVIRGWQESGGSASPLGVPSAPGLSGMYSEQHFERGIMQWRQGTTGPNWIYVFDIQSTLPSGTDWFGREDGIWQRYDDLWTPEMPLFPEACPDAGWPNGPMFGFGVTWCNEPGVKATIGYPIGAALVDQGADQAFENGAVLWSPASDSYMVLYGDGRWQYYRAHRRYPVDVGEPNITGRVVMQGRIDHRGVILSIDGGPYMATDPQGRFGFSAARQLTVHFDHPGYLGAVATIKAVPGVSADLGEIALIGGDVTGDRRVDILDISYVAYRFAGSDATADLTGDGVVDILDLSMVGANFGQTGPVHWQR